MSKRQPELFLIDILVAIDDIRKMTAEISFELFVSDQKTCNATLQSLVVIGEAAKMLLQNPEFLKESKTEWQRIVDFRNIVVHEYFGIDYDYVFWIIQDKIPSLEQDVFDLMKQKKDKSVLLLAIEKMKVQLAKINRHENISYLEEVESRLE